MPETRLLTAEELDKVEAAGGDRAAYEGVPVQISPERTPAKPEMGLLRSAVAPLKAHAGGLAGAGIGGLAALALAPETFGASLLYPLIGSMIGSAGGKYGQEKLMDPTNYAALQQEANAAYEANPLVSRGTELAVGAMLGGGKFSPSTLRTALTGKIAGGVENLTSSDIANIVRQARGSVFTGNALGVGAQTGLTAAEQLYKTGKIDPAELAKNAAEGFVTGALFSAPNALGSRFSKHWRPIEETVEGLRDKNIEYQENEKARLAKDAADAQAGLDNLFNENINNALNLGASQDKQQTIAADNAKKQQDINNAKLWLDPTQTLDKHVNDAMKAVKLPIKKEMDGTDRAAALAHNNRIDSLDMVQKRQMLFQDALKNIAPEIAAAHVDSINEYNNYKNWRDNIIDQQKKAEGAEQQQYDLANAQEQAAKQAKGVDYEKMHAEELQQQAEHERKEQQQQAEHERKIAEMEKEAEIGLREHRQKQEIIRENSAQTFFKEQQRLKEKAEKKQDEMAKAYAELEAQKAQEQKERDRIAAEAEPMIAERQKQAEAEKVARQAMFEARIRQTPEGAKVVPEPMTAEQKLAKQQQARAAEFQAQLAQQVKKKESPVLEAPLKSRVMGENADYATPPSDEAGLAALTKASKTPEQIAKFGAARSLPEGTPVESRIDINAFKKGKDYVITHHAPSSKGAVGPVIGYDTAARLKNPVFEVKTGKGGVEAIRQSGQKFPVATVKGNLSQDRSVPADINSWTPVGFDPMVHDHFYNKHNDKIVTGGDEAYSVGNTVFVKNPKYSGETLGSLGSSLGSRVKDNPKFKEWFGNSKLVDENGDPMVMYHGTDQDIERFKLSKEGNLGKGIYLTPDPTRASAYADVSAEGVKRKQGANVLPLHAALKNPLEIEHYKNTGSQEGTSALMKLGLSKEKARDIIEKGFEKNGNLTGELFSRAKAAGHDGIIVRKDGKIYEALAFDPTQVKSAFNKGEYSSTNSHILESIADEQNHAPLNNATADHIINDKSATVKSTLELIAADKNNPFNELAAKYLKTMDKDGLDVRIFHKPNADASVYNSAKDYIVINNEGLTANTLIHEIVHAGTVRSIPKELMTLEGTELKNAIDKYIQSEDTNPNVKEILQCYLDTAKHLGLTNDLFGPASQQLAGAPRTAVQELPGLHREIAYGMGHIGEFISQINSSDPFREMLAGIKTKDERNILQRFYDAVKNLFGLKGEERTMLDRASEVSDKLIAEERGTGNKFDYSNVTDDSGLLFAQKNKGEKEDYVSRTIGKLTGAANDKIRSLGTHGEGDNLANAVHKTLDTAQKLTGKWWSPLDDITSKMSSASRDKVERALYTERLTKQSLRGTLRGDEVKAYDMVRKIYKEIADNRERINEPVMRNGKPTPMQRDPFYHATTEELSVGTDIREGTNPEKVAGYKKAYVENYAKLNPTEGLRGAEHAWEELVKAHQGSAQYSGEPSLAIFGAMRKEEGTPLPDEMRRKDLRENMFNYIRRAAMDMAHYEHIESKHDVAASLGYTKDAWGNVIDNKNVDNLNGNDAVKVVMKTIRGEISPLGARNAKALESLATSATLGPATEVHKTLSPIAQAIGYTSNPMDAAKMIVHAVTNMGEGWTRAKEGGVVIHRPNDVKGFWDTHITFAENVNNLSSRVRRIYTLNGLTEQWGVGMAQASAEYIIPTKLQMANNGDKTSQVLMKSIDPDYTVGKTYSKSEMKGLASSFAGVLHGTRDARSLPAALLHDSEISAFVKLLSWNIGQTNNFIKHQWQPALKGDYKPLMMATFGATLGGLVIKELREKVMGKNSNIPSLTDAASSSRGLEGNIRVVAYNWIAAAGYGGLGGIVSMVAKYPFDIAYRNAPQGAVFPLDELASSYATQAFHIADALANDPMVDPLKLANRAIGDIITKNTQLGRVGLNQLINAGAIKEDTGGSLGELAYEHGESEKLNQLKRFNQVEGIPVAPEETTNSNPYLGMQEKEFKHTADMGKAAEMLPELVNGIIRAYGNSPELMLSKLQGLKAAPYDVMPSLENHPMAFSRYVQFLNTKYGAEETNKLIEDYLRRKAINKAKGSMIP